MDALYIDASVLRPQGMATPQEILKQAIEESSLTPTEIGRKMGYAHPYQAIHDLISGKRKFTPEKQAAIADILNLPRDHFANPDLTEARMEWIETEWRKFLETETAAELSDDDRQLIYRMGRQFLGQKLPTKAFFQHLVLVVQGKHTTEQLERALRKNEALDAHLAQQAELKREKTGNFPKKRPPPKVR